MRARDSRADDDAFVVAPKKRRWRKAGDARLLDASSCSKVEILKNGGQITVSHPSCIVRNKNRGNER